MYEYAPVKISVAIKTKTDLKTVSGSMSMLIRSVIYFLKIKSAEEKRIKKINKNFLTPPQKDTPATKRKKAWKGRCWKKFGTQTWWLHSFFCFGPRGCL